MKFRVAVAVVTIIAALFPVVASADTIIIVNERFDFTQDRVNSCNGESLTFHGILHRLEVVLPDSTHKILIEVEATAVGDQSNTYGVLGYHHITTQPDGSFLEVFRDRLISRGSAPNQHVLLITSGPPFTFRFESSCRG